MTRDRLAAARDQEGFTLVELIVAMVLVGIVGFPLIESFIEAVKTTGATSTSLGSSHDAQLVDYYLQRDASGAAATNAPTTWACAAAAGVTVGSGATGLIQFTWPQAPQTTSSTLASGYPVFASGASYEADYVYQGADLTRYYCSVSGVVGTLIQASKVASSLSLTSPPTVPSLNDQCNGGSGLGTCTTVAWTDAAGRAYSTILYDRSFGS